MKIDIESQVKTRSHEVQEIIGQVPNSITRWGMTVIFFVLLFLLMVSWFIKYPDILIAKVLITTYPSPITIVPKQNGNLILIKEDHSLIKKGELIAFIRSNAMPDAILSLERNLLDNNPEMSSVLNGSLGDLEAGYSKFLNQQLALKTFENEKIYDVKIRQLRIQGLTYKKLNQSIQSQNLILSNEIKLANEKFKTDSVLFEQKVTSNVDYNQSKSIWLQQLRSGKASETSLINNEILGNQLKQQIIDLELGKFEKHQNLKLEVENARKELLASITKWKDNFLFIAPQSGKLALLDFIENEKFIEAGKAIMSLTSETGQIVAHAELSIKGAGKVKKGQRVNIRLENYPFEQYGIINGLISDISVIPVEEKYLVKIVLPNKLKTNQSIDLPVNQELIGTTEIITDDLRLLERFFHVIRKLINAR